MSRIRLKQIANFKQLDKELFGSSLLRNTDVVAFDVFDTLLFRRCDADDVQLGVARALGHSLGNDESSDIAILRVREQAYFDAAAENEFKGFDKDAHLDDINLAWVKRLAPNEPGRWSDLAAVARESKIRYEHWACFPNPATVPILQRLAGTGKRAVFVSDMYLGEAIVSDLLTANGLRQFFSAGYVSGDIALTKSSGRLFQHVLEKEGIDGSRMLHIGDNPHADGRRAIEHGIKAIVVRERDIPLKRMRFDHNYALQDRRWLGYNAASFASAASLQQVEPELHTIGRDVLGPPFSAFIHGLAEYCMRIRPDAVYFLSREGLLLKDLYDQLIATLQLPLPSGGYLCTSRLNAAVAAMRSFGWREITLKLGSHNKPTVSSIFSPLGFSRDELASIAGKCGISDIDQKFIIDSPTIARLVAHPILQDRAIRLGQNARNALHEYLEKRGFFNARSVVLVDVGWAGQIQEGLKIALSDSPAPIINVYYLGANQLAGERRRSGLNIRAYLADMEQYDWLGSATFEFVELFEIPSRALHGTVLGHNQGEPLFASEDSAERTPEHSDEPRIALLQEGICEYMLHYARYAAITKTSADHAKTYAINIVARIVRFPRRSELFFFSSLNHIANFGSSEHLQLAKVSSILSGKKFLDAVNNSHWRQGAAALGLGRFGALLLSLFQAPRISRTLPSQIEEQRIHDGASIAAWNPFSPLPHGFETDVRNRSFVLLEQGREASLHKTYRSPLTPFELAMLHLGLRATNLYLSVKKLNQFPADLLPLRAWLWREIYIRLPVHGKFGRLLRRVKRWITA
ncbi:HAD family hydrolase [Thiocystis violascens]|uniref:Haloacid dehalogenase superfamily enzyme, subfamily IA n=1 Tax=Thiocystis violascens (strain ATCC 17096 / DSM 198 / 6111) TaxID=765911 RepID=I3Y5D7_THIV6|nr:HAD family hydrolase [Thiocystis violascens]AFL72205.1 hypothetical protein Thivi_0129 [Thiocystis violascens DSM 198]